MIRRLTPVLRELLGLFVDDVGFALAILIWLMAFALLLSRIPLPLPWRGALLFIGLAVILVWHCLRHIAHWTDHTPRDVKS